MVLDCPSLLDFLHSSTHSCHHAGFRSHISLLDHPFQISSAPLVRFIQLRTHHPVHHHSTRPSHSLPSSILTPPVPEIYNLLYPLRSQCPTRKPQSLPPELVILLIHQSNLHFRWSRTFIVSADICIETSLVARLERVRGKGWEFYDRGECVRGIIGEVKQFLPDYACGSIDRCGAIEGRSGGRGV